MQPETAPAWEVPDWEVSVPSATALTFPGAGEAWTPQGRSSSLCFAASDSQTQKKSSGSDSQGRTHRGADPHWSQP